MPHGSPGVLHERREDWRWRAEQAELTFETPGGKEHGAQRSDPCPGNEVFALWSRTGTRHCLVAVTGTGASTASVFGSDSLDFSPDFSSYFAPELAVRSKRQTTKGIGNEEAVGVENSLCCP